MNSIKNISKTNMAINRENYLKILAACYMKLKLKMFMTTLVTIKKCLVLLFTMLSQNITIIQTHYSWLNEI